MTGATACAYARCVDYGATREDLVARAIAPDARREDVLRLAVFAMRQRRETGGAFAAVVAELDAEVKSRETHAAESAAWHAAPVAGEEDHHGES